MCASQTWVLKSVTVRDIPKLQNNRLTEPQAAPGVFFVHLALVFSARQHICLAHYNAIARPSVCLSVHPSAKKTNNLANTPTVTTIQFNTSQCYFAIAFNFLND